MPPKKQIVRRVSPPALPDVPEIAKQMASNPNIHQFSLFVDKSKGVVRATAKGRNGKTVTKEILAPGLETVTQFNPSDRASRNAGIRALLSIGFTQQETAVKIGCSQALVSNVSRRRA